MRPALVVLAAGASTRLGTCKALVDLGGRTALARLLDAGACCAAAPPLVVTGADHVAIAAAAPAGVEVLFNPRWSDGRMSGIALAAGARAGLDLVLAPVDVPLAPAEVFERLAAAWADAGAPARGWLAPWVAGSRGTPRWGHPVLAGRELLHELVSERELALELESGRERKNLPDAAHAPPLPPPRSPPSRFPTLRGLRLRADPMLGCEVASERVLDDLDLPADLERLRRLVS